MAEEISHHQYTQIVILGGSLVCCAFLICELLRKRRGGGGGGGGGGVPFGEHTRASATTASRGDAKTNGKKVSTLESHNTVVIEELEFTGIRRRKSNQTSQHCECCSKLRKSATPSKGVRLSDGDDGQSDSDFRNGLGYTSAASISRGRGRVERRSQHVDATTVGLSMFSACNSDDDVRPLQTSTPRASAPVSIADHSSQTDLSGACLTESGALHGATEENVLTDISCSLAEPNESNDCTPTKEPETKLPAKNLFPARKAESDERVMDAHEELEIESIKSSASTSHSQKSRRRKKRKGRQESPMQVFHSNQENELPKKNNASKRRDFENEIVIRSEALKDVLINKENMMKSGTAAAPKLETDVISSRAIPPKSKPSSQELIHPRPGQPETPLLISLPPIDCWKFPITSIRKPVERNTAHDSLDSGVDLSQNVGKTPHQLGLSDSASLSVSLSPNFSCSASPTPPVKMRNASTSTIDANMSANSTNSAPMLVTRGTATCAIATRSTGTAMTPTARKTIGTCTPPNRMQRRSINGVETESHSCRTEADEADVVDCSNLMKVTKNYSSCPCYIPASPGAQGDVDQRQLDAKKVLPRRWLAREDVHGAMPTSPTSQSSQPSQPSQPSKAELAAFNFALPRHAGPVLANYQPTMDSVYEGGMPEFLEDNMDVQSLHSCSEEVLDSLSRLGLNCSSVSSRFDNWVVSLQDLPENRDILRKKKSTLELEWSMARRLYHCIEIHIKNASNYQKFMNSATVLQGKIVQLQRRVETLSKVPPNSASVNRDFLLCHLAEINEVVKEAVKNSNSIQELYELSSSIHPVHKRVEPVSQPVEVEMICPFRDGSVELSTGDKLKLMDNSSPKKWRLKHAEEELEMSIPAVTVLIPPPDHQSLDAVQKLSVQMNAVWKTHGDAWTVRVMWLTLLVLQDIVTSQECRSASCEETEAMLRSLSVLDGVLSLADSSDARDDILQQVYQIRDDLFQNRSEGGSSKTESCPLSVRMMSQLADIYSALQVEPHGRCGLQLLVGGHDEELPDAEEQTPPEDLTESATSESSQTLMMPVEVSVERQHESAQASSIRASLQEVRQTFAIGAVLDPIFDRLISVQEAIELGIIDAASGTYRNIHSGITLPIPEAMSRGLILVEGTKTMATREQSASMGVLTVTVTRETRPYTIRRVLHPITEQMISVKEAIQAGIFSPATGTYTNTETDEELDVEAAIDSGLLHVDYDESVPRGDPIVTKKCFAVYSVTDRSASARLTFSQAEKRGIIDAETGQFTDNLTGQTMHLSEALRKGYVRARAFADMDSLEVWVARRAGRRGSTASSLSTLSGWSQASSELMARAYRH